MNPSQVTTYALPYMALGRASTPGSNPALLAYAPPAGPPLRVLVRNVSEAADVILAHDSESLATIPMTSSSFEIPAGNSEVFVLAPGQKLFAASTSADARASVAVSEAMPLDAKA